MQGDTEKYRFALDVMLKEAMKDRQAYLDVVAGAWHKAMGGYPAKGSHSMPIVCDVMWKEFSERHGDAILYSPLKKKGAKLKIRYNLPR